jgi:hypothetical protein
MLSLLIIIHDFLKQMSSLQTSYLIMFCSTLYIIYFCNELLLLILLQLIKKEWISFGGCCWVHKKQWISFVHFLILLLIIVYDFLKQKSCNVLFSITNLSLNWYFFIKYEMAFFVASAYAFVRMHWTSWLMVYAFLLRKLTLEGIMCGSQLLTMAE